MRRKTAAWIFAAFGMAVLILDAKTSLEGAAEGLQLCVRVVIPSLLPLFFLSALLTASLSDLSFRWMAPIARFCKIPQNAQHLLLVGLVGGYPVGAQSVADAYDAGCLDRKCALRLLGFVSNAGPAFIFSMAAYSFSDRTAPFALWAIHILSALLTGFLLPGGNSDSRTLVVKRQEMNATAALGKTLRVLAFVCGWVILFRVLITFVDRWFLWYFSDTVRTGIHMVLELANGCMELDRIPNEGLQFMVCAAGLGFGGICVLMQTRAVTGPLGLGQYIPGKLLQSMLSLLLAWLWQLFAFDEQLLAFPLIGIMAAVTPAYILAMHKYEKRSRNLCTVGV